MPLVMRPDGGTSHIDGFKKEYAKRLNVTFNKENMLIKLLGY